MPTSSSPGARPPDGDSILPRDQAAGSHWRLWPIFALAGTAGALLGWFVYGQIRSPIPFGYFSHPPLYGIWAPTIDRLTLLVIPAALFLAAVGWLITASRRVPTWLALVLVIAGGLCVAAMGELVRGDWHDLTRDLSTSDASPHYAADLNFVQQYGVRGFAERRPDLTDDFRSYHSKTHPAGALILLHVLFKLLGAGHPLRIATVVAGIGLLAAVAAWSMGTALGGDRAGRIAAVLFVAAPGPLMLAYTSMDAVFATVLTGAAALFMIAVHRSSAAMAAAAGAVLALGTLLTFATAFLALAAAITIAIQAPDGRSRLRLLGAATAGGLATLGLAWVALGMDVVSAWLSAPQSGHPYDPYWIIANPAAVLMYAGLPVAALGIAGLVRRPPQTRRPVLILVLCVVMLVWGSLPSGFTDLRPGEVERTWAFLYPMLAAVAGVVVDRWTRDAGRWRGPIVAALVILAVAQTVLLHSLWDNLA
jgi:hypothetical protein